MKIEKKNPILTTSLLAFFLLARGDGVYTFLDHLIQLCHLAVSPPQATITTSIGYLFWSLSTKEKARCEKCSRDTVDYNVVCVAAAPCNMQTRRAEGFHGNCLPVKRAADEEIVPLFVNKRRRVYLFFSFSCLLLLFFCLVVVGSFFFLLFGNISNRRSNVSK